MAVNDFSKDSVIELVENSTKLLSLEKAVDRSIYITCFGVVHFICDKYKSSLSTFPEVKLKHFVIALLRYVDRLAAIRVSEDDTLRKTSSIVLHKVALSFNCFTVLTLLLDLIKSSQLQYKVLLRLTLCTLDELRKSDSRADDDSLTRVYCTLDAIVQAQSTNYFANVRMAKIVHDVLIAYCTEERINQILSSSNISLAYIVERPEGNPNNGEKLSQDIVQIINEITYSKDKSGAISRLHQLRLANPTLDLNRYFEKLSVPFRRHVFDLLSKCEDVENKTVTETLPDASGQDGQLKTEVADSSTSINASGGSRADEAFRIIENLKFPPPSYKPSSSFRPEEEEEGAVRENSSQNQASRSFARLNSPFAQRNDKIRDSLSTLSKTLDLPTSLASENNLLYSETLEERLQRLKSLK